MILKLVCIKEYYAKIIYNLIKSVGLNMNKSLYNIDSTLEIVRDDFLKHDILNQYMDIKYYSTEIKDFTKLEIVYTEFTSA